MPEIPRPTDPLAGDWMMIILLVALGVLGWVNVVSPKKWRLMTRSLFALRLGRQSLRDELDVQDRTLIALMVMASAAVALFAGQCITVVTGSPTGPLRWAEFFGISLLVLTAHLLLLRLATLLFQADGGGTEYQYTTMLIHAGLGIGLLPLIATIAWPHSPEWRGIAIRAGLILLVAATLFRWLRALVLGLGEGVPLRYVLIYLCALEILPAALACQQVLKAVPGPFTTL